MKIYHKNNFAKGVFMLGLGVLNLVINIINNSITIKDGILSTVLFLIGGTLLVRSLSKSISRNDKIETMDERNRLIKLKSGSRALVISQYISFFLILCCVAVYTMTKSIGFIGIMIGLVLAWVISILVEAFTYIYYESKN